MPSPAFRSAALAVAMLAAKLAVAQNILPHGALFALTNDPAGNQIISYDRVGPEGELVRAGAFDVGGVGINFTGSGLNPLGSQDAIIVSPDNAFVFAVNAGSNTVASFAVDGAALTRRDLQPSGGITPVSLTLHGRVLYVVNAADGGSIRGFRVGSSGVLRPIEGATVNGIGADAGAIEFSPDGRRLFITERISDQIIRVDVDRLGRPGAITRFVSPVPEPFGTDIRADGVLLISEANDGIPEASSLSSYRIDQRSGELTLVSEGVITGYTFGCWVEFTDDGRYAYVSNTPDGVMTSYAVAPDGTLTLLAGNAGQTGPGVLDAEMAGNQLYVVVNGEGSIAQFTVASDGSLVRNEDIEVSDDAFLPSFFAAIAGY